MNFRAAMLVGQSSALEVREVERSEHGLGGALVVWSPSVLAYARDVFGGERPYGLPFLSKRGCEAVGRIRELRPDATELKVGGWLVSRSKFDVGRRELNGDLWGGNERASAAR